MTRETHTKPVGVALVGAGVIGRRHVEALSDMGDLVALRAIVSRSAEASKPLAALYDGALPSVTSDIAEVCDDPNIQMAIIATPPSVRRHVIAPLAAAGVHILLEKPIARTLREAEEIVDLCDAANVTLGIVFQHRFRASAIEAARVVATGDLGRLGVVEISVPLWRDQAYYDERGRGTYARDGGGVMLTNAIHSLDLALSLAGPVTHVQAMTATSLLHDMEAEDLAVAGLEFACGAKGAFVASTAVFPHRTEVVRLHFEHGSLRIDKSDVVISWRDGRKQTLPAFNAAQTASSPQENHVLWHRLVIEDFVTAIQAGGAPKVTGKQGLDAQRLISAIEQSARSGARVMTQ